MKQIVSYLQDYIRSIRPVTFGITTLFTAILIVLNYTIELEPRLFNMPTYFLQFVGFTLFFAFTFSVAWLIQGLTVKEAIITNRFFYIILIATPIIFGAKITFDWASHWIAYQMDYPWNEYWNLVLNWPLKCLLVLVLVTAIWKWGRYEEPVAGMLLGSFPAKPYLVMLAIMAPLIALAATRPDFLYSYPKMQRVAFIDQYVGQSFWYKLLFELSYGIDFITIEFFFRGFVVLAFVRYAGRHAILPMAALYCSIHFGKPLAECITSYFGGILLGVVVLNTRSIWGGLIVHLGIAWMMELAGSLGHLAGGT